MNNTVVMCIALIVVGCGGRSSGSKPEFEIRDSGIFYAGQEVSWMNSDDATIWITERGFTNVKVIISEESGVIPLMFFSMVEEKAKMQNSYWWKCDKCGQISEMKNEDDGCGKCK